MPVQPRSGSPLVSLALAMVVVAVVLGMCGRSDWTAETRVDSSLQASQPAEPGPAPPADLQLVSGPDLRPPPTFDEVVEEGVADWAVAVAPDGVVARHPANGDSPTTDMPAASDEPDRQAEPEAFPSTSARGLADPGHPAEDQEPAGSTPPTLSLSPSRAFEIEEFDDDALVASQATVDDVLAYFPAQDQLSDQLKPRVQAAFTLARNGALHAARFRFEQLLAELAQAKDASQMTSRHARALAAGLRALEEADDFMVHRGDRTADTRSLAAGHQTPMLHETDAKWTLPPEAMAMYHVYAEKKLASAVADEPAGSMVLFGLGKIYAQLAERDKLDQAKRKSLTLYRASLAAHEQNHLAANEAGVLLARGGRYAQAAELLERSARLGQSSVTYRNLAYVHEKLGDTQLAQHHRAEAERIAAREVAQGQLSAERGIVWLSPDEFNRRSHSTEGRVTVAQRPPAPVAPPPGTEADVPPPEDPAPQATEPPSPRRSTLWW